MAKKAACVTRNGLKLDVAPIDDSDDNVVLAQSVIYQVGLRGHDQVGFRSRGGEVVSVPARLDLVLCQIRAGLKPTC